MRHLYLVTAEALSGIQLILLCGVFVQGRLYRLPWTILAAAAPHAARKTTPARRGCQRVALGVPRGTLSRGQRKNASPFVLALCGKCAYNFCTVCR
jgi:hypothetical protein